MVSLKSPGSIAAISMCTRTTSSSTNPYFHESLFESYSLHQISFWPFFASFRLRAELDCKHWQFRGFSNRTRTPYFSLVNAIAAIFLYARSLCVPFQWSVHSLDSPCVQGHHKTPRHARLWRARCSSPLRCLENFGLGLLS